MRQSWRRVRTSAGGHIYFMDLADLEGTLRVVVPGEVYTRGRNAFRQGVPMLIEGRLELGRDSEEPVLRASRVAGLAN